MGNRQTPSVAGMTLLTTMTLVSRGLVRRSLGCSWRIERMRGWVLFGGLMLAAGTDPAFTAERSGSSPSGLRGRESVRKPLNPPFWSLRAYQDAWKRWGLAKQPADYDRAFRERYGLHAPPYENGGLPMGFTRPRGLLGLGQGLGNDCLLCHAGTVAGQTIIGLGNSALDMQSLYEELAAADGLDPIMPLPLCNVRGTSEASNFAVYLMQFRDAELRHRLPVKYPLCETLCEDIPAWWHLRKKKTIYHLGVADSRSVRTLMPFLLIPGNSAESIKQREPEFAEIRAYLLSLEPPRYPYAIDRTLAEQGQVDLRAHLRAVPRHLRRRGPLPQQAYTTRGDRHRCHPGARLRPGRRCPLPRELVRPRARPCGRALSRPGRRRLSGPSPRRHLGDRTLPSQRVGTDNLSRSQIWRASPNLHPQLPRRCAGVRPAQGGVEVRDPGKRPRTQPARN